MTDPRPQPPDADSPDADFYDLEYNARLSVPEHPAIFARWARDAEIARERSEVLLDLAYGDSPAERLDLFPAEQPDAPLFVFIHGGYWRSLDKSDFSWVAPPLVAEGISVALPNYALAPAVSIETIVRQMLAAHAWLYRQAAGHGYDRRRIVVGGQSAGGHLSAMMLCAQWSRWAEDLPDDLVRGAVSISGLFDLAPLVHARFLQDDLKLDDAAARRLSPLHMPPARGKRLVAAVGADESSEFRRQVDALAARWPAGSVAPMKVPGRNHFTVVDALAETDHDLFRTAIELCQR